MSVLMPRRAWTPAEDAQLRELAAERLSHTAIAHRMGRTAFAVKQRAQKLGVHFQARRAWTGPEMRRLLRLRDRGRTWREVAQALGRSLWAVHQQIGKIRLALKYGPGVSAAGQVSKPLEQDFPHQGRCNRDH